MNEPTLAKWLRYLIYASALVPLIIFSQYISPFHFGKVVVFRSVVQVMLALYLLLIWRDRSYLPKRHPLMWAFLAFALAFTLTSITSVDALQSYIGTLERMGGLFTFWHYFVFFVITVSVLRTRKDWQTLLNIMIATGLASAIYGFLQKTGWSFILGAEVGGRARPFGTIGNPALFAGYQIVVAFLALTLSFMKRTARNWRIGYWIAGGAMILAAMTTAVRGSLMGIAAGALIGALLWAILNHSKKARMTLIAGLAGAVVFVFAAIMLRNTSMVKNSPYLSRITDFSSSTFTVQTRLWAWEAGFKGWKENPKTVMLGWGPENFNVPFSKYFNPKFYNGPGAETFFDRAHNMFIEVLVTMGLLGLLAYLSIFAALFWTLAKMMRSPGDERVVGIGLTAMTVAYIIHNSFIFDTSANFLTFFMVMAFVMHVALAGLDNERVRVSEHRVLTNGKWTPVQLSAAALLAIVVLIAVYRTNIRPTLANFASTRAIIAGWRGDFATAVGKNREAINYDVPGRYEFRNQLTQYLLQVSTSADISRVPNYNQDMLDAVSDEQKNSAENPHDYLPLLYLSRLYITLGRDDPKSPYNDLALKASNDALKISPTFVRTYFEIAQAYLNKKDYDSAYQWFSKALDLNPDVSITKWYMGLVLIQKGQFTKDTEPIKQGLLLSLAAIQEGYVITESDAQKLAGAFVSVGDLKNLAALYEQMVQNFPQQEAYWEQLIAVYIKLNNKDAAIATIRRALALPGVGDNPAFKTKAQNTLKQLGVK